MKEIYLDHAATTQVDKSVLQEMLPYFSQVYGNPGSFHYKGLQASDVLDSARIRTAKILNCKPKEIVFTSGGTESINFALKGIALANKEKGNHIIISSIEHHAVLHTCDFLKSQGFVITLLPVDKYGFVSAVDLQKAIKPETILVSIMYANNEIGTIQNISELAKITKEKSIPFHTDACQAAGCLDLDVEKLCVDLMTLNASKIYGPKGTGLLYIRSGIEIEPLIHGGGQENNLRSGTENVPGIVGFVKALELAQEKKEYENARLIQLRDTLISGLLKLPKARLNGPIGEKRLPNNINVSFLDIEGESMILMLNEQGVFASTGSACASKSLETSHVLRAIGLPYEASHGSLRFTLGRETTLDDIYYVLRVMPDIIAHIKKLSPLNLDMEHFK